MNLLHQGLSVILLSALTVTAAFAGPEFLITHNKTDKESNAFVAGTIPSPYPTAANSTRQVYWNMVKIACYGHISNGKCAAVIKVDTRSLNPIEVGEVSMDLNSGAITPERLSANGYTFQVNGPGEATLYKD